MVTKTFGFIYTFECIPLCLNHSMQKVSILLLLATHYMTTPLTSFFLYHNKLPNKLWDKDKNKFARESNFLCLEDLKQCDMLFYKQHFYKQCQGEI